MSAGGQIRWIQALEAAMAANSKVHHSRFVQLATVATVRAQSPELQQQTVIPAVRTVVFRGFRRGNHRELVITTDGQSEKVGQITQNPHAEICWYFTETQEQFRLGGHVSLVFANTVFGWASKEPFAQLQQDRVEAWKNMPPHLQELFFKAAYKNCTSIGSKTQLQDLQHRHEEQRSNPQPYDNFVLVLFKVERVDHLQLTDPPKRVLSTLIEDAGEGTPEAEGQWKEEEVDA